MLAKNYDDVELVHTPCIAQPKLNGLRAYWDEGELASREQTLWKKKKLPHIYEKLEAFSAKYPGIILDGELYCHGMPLQDIRKRCCGGIRHPDYRSIDFHAFDVVSPEPTEVRQQFLLQHYSPFVPCARIEGLPDIPPLLERFIECGFEGMMLRQLNQPYEHGRSNYLIKLKPWQYATGVVTGFTPGEGKYLGKAGALIVKSGNITFRVSGGLSDQQREVVAIKFSFFKGRKLLYKYRELSNSGKPLQPQIHQFV